MRNSRFVFRRYEFEMVFFNYMTFILKSQVEKSGLVDIVDAYFISNNGILIT